MPLSSPVLVTGSSGRLGRELVGLLLAHGYTVVGVDVVPATTTDRVLDIRDVNAVLAVTREVGTILHTAALHGKHYCTIRALILCAPTSKVRCTC